MGQELEPRKIWLSGILPLTRTLALRRASETQLNLPRRPALLSPRKRRARLRVSTEVAAETVATPGFAHDHDFGNPPWRTHFMGADQYPARPPDFEHPPEGNVDFLYGPNAEPDGSCFDRPSRVSQGPMFKLSGAIRLERELQQSTCDHLPALTCLEETRYLSV